MLPKTIVIRRNDKSVTVDTQDYIQAKTLELKEFGYSDLSLGVVAEQLDLMLQGNKILNIIGMFIKDDVLI